jgi:hypothetical protein
MSLDDALAAATPPTAPRTPALERELHALVAEAEAVTRRGRRHRRIGIAVVSALSVIPLTAAASAAGVLPSWVPWTTDGGSTCQMAFTASALGPNGEPLGRSYADPSTQSAVREASRFLSTFNYDSIDQTAAIARFRKQEQAAIASQDDPDEVQPHLTGDDLALTAVYAEVWKRLEEHLRAEGIPTDRIGLGQAWSCE